MRLHHNQHSYDSLSSGWPSGLPQATPPHPKEPWSLLQSLARLQLRGTLAGGLFEETGLLFKLDSADFRQLRAKSENPKKHGLVGG
jgi:hypothetical protein